jgi:ketosteroid isomerase-like protein
MSGGDVEVVRRTLEAFNEGGVEAILADFDREVEWLGPPEWLEDRAYRGHDGLRKLAGVWVENFDEYRLDPERLIEAGDRVVALVHQRGRIKGSTVPVVQQVGFLWTVRDGRTVHVEAYFSWEEALEAGGLDQG